MTDEPTPNTSEPAGEQPAGEEPAGDTGQSIEPDSGADNGHGGAHSASHGARRVGGTRSDRNIVVFGLGMLFCAILVAFVPDIAPNPTATAPDRLHGRIVTVVPGGVASASATVTVVDGDRRGDVISAVLEGPTGTTGAADVPAYAPGDEVVVAVDTTADGGYSYAVVDRWRLPVVGALLGVFVLALIAFAGWAGLRTVTALAITLAVVVRLLVPLLLAGYEPVAVVVALGILITTLTLLLTHGLSRATGAALAGTTAALLLTAALAVGVSAAARFSLGQGSEEIVVLGQLLGGSIDLSGILFAAVVFGGLGVLADVAVSQAVSVEEFARLDDSATVVTLFRRGMAGGVAHLAAAVNTLLLAYVGAALPIVVILALQAHRLDLALNDEHVAVEVVRIFVGGLGVIAAVPLTTAIAAVWVVRAGRSRRRGPRVMASRLADTATRAGWLERIRRARSGLRRPPVVEDPGVAPAEAFGRRRSARPARPARSARPANEPEQPIPTEPVAVAVAAVASGEPNDVAETDHRAKPASAVPTVATDLPPVPVPPTQPDAGRRPRPRRPGR